MKGKSNNEYKDSFNNDHFDSIINELDMNLNNMIDTVRAYGRIKLKPCEFCTKGRVTLNADMFDDEECDLREDNCRDRHEEDFDFGQCRCRDRRNEEDDFEECRSRDRSNRNWNFQEERDWAWGNANYNVKENSNRNQCTKDISLVKGNCGNVYNGYNANYSYYGWNYAAYPYQGMQRNNESTIIIVLIFLWFLCGPIIWF